MAKARLKRAGSKLVKVPLRASFKPGKYRVVVRVFKGSGRRQISRSVTIAIVVTK